MGQGRYDNNCKKKSGQVPRFGEWEEASEMPITQYFENPRQAAEALKLASHHPRPRHLHPSRQTAGTNERRRPQRRVRDVSAQTDKYYVDVTGVKQHQNNVASASRPPKPVDEDLYKIPPELLYSSRRRTTRLNGRSKNLGFFETCSWINQEFLSIAS
ncbi:hypothetical protein IGI04_004975 [Brassica rapa subsp. trilocularis]|uniref:RIN4 pathogenic type III effector avirulence factor Avr cleavage site domain-containing protein n=1 Tax=Brassica rapa subsp. trilocularis TaxID=1813537 RepID=A0ABQ7NEH4_BRACM|nr:hypothetical protein IGI04_004975 [Brassica rapa subsp. trilocularis]